MQSPARLSEIDRDRLKGCHFCGELHRTTKYFFWAGFEQGPRVVEEHRDYWGRRVIWKERIEHKRYGPLQRFGVLVCPGCVSRLWRRYFFSWLLGCTAVCLVAVGIVGFILLVLLLKAKTFHAAYLLVGLLALPPVPPWLWFAFRFLVPTSEHEVIEQIVIFNVRGEYSIHGDSFFTDTCYRRSIGFR
jgi:hypothetical protein